jgi:hypothetical protein
MRRAQAVRARAELGGGHKTEDCVATASGVGAWSCFFGQRCAVDDPRSPVLASYRYTVNGDLVLPKDWFGG